MRLDQLAFVHVMRHAILFLQHIFWYCSGMLLLSVCFRLSDDKFRENNILTCPAGYIYYSTNHNDGVEDYFNQTGNGEFKKHGKINVMHMLRFRSTEPCTKPSGAYIDRSSKTTLNFSRHYVKLFCNPLGNFAKVFSGISLNENGYRLLCVGSRRFVS